MNYYEILYIVNPNYGKEKISEIIHDINKHIETKKHSVLEHDFWGKKQLAYNIKKEKYGNYVLLQTEFNDSNFVNDFKAFLNLNSEVLKYLIIKLDDKPLSKKELEELEELEEKENE
jgi:small subunit ribosomal protein S6